MKESPKQNKTQLQINPGSVVLGHGTQVKGEGTEYRVIFTCRKSGFDFLGQAQVDPEKEALKVELFNENYFGLFKAPKEAVQVSLENKVATLLCRLTHLPEAYQSVVKSVRKVKRSRQVELRFEEDQPEENKDDLQAIFERLNQKHFRGGLEGDVEWGKDSKTLNRRSFSFGSYDARKKLIRLHPRLKQEFVPFSVLELTIYHEMCHQFLPPVKRNGKWQTHNKQFKLKEREYRNYREAMAWEKANWAKLLAPIKE